ncbi:Agamous-like MADS-box protein AGL80 [Platanthera guangdongensis]|uniref:Agamous-like MADS-box protein AGL80 n=1 Tax=Platanthera guangdongensis TaxID=2320717 RepID=A0ABR2MUI4_9ASPA
MARKKVTLAYIPNDATRRATLKKRRCGLMKKVAELSVLCGVPACAVVYAPQDDKPEIFPSAEEVKQIFTDLGNMPEIDKNKKMVNQKTFLEQRLLKLNQQVRRLDHENRELAGAVCLRRCLAGLPVEIHNKEDAEALLEMLDRRSKAVQTRLHQLGAPPIALGLPTPPLLAMPVAERSGFDAPAIEAMQRCNWIGCGGEMASGMMNYGQQMVGGSGCGDSAGDDDVLSLFLEQEFITCPLN